MCGFSLGTFRLPATVQKHYRLIGDSKIVLRIECERVWGCLYSLSLCGPVDCRLVQGVPRLSPDDCWDRLQPPLMLENKQPERHVATTQV